MTRLECKGLADHRKGFALIEIQISLVMLALAVATLGHACINYTTQLRWLELKRASFAVVDAGLSKVVFGHYRFGTSSDPIVYRVEALDIQDTLPGLTATVELKTP